MPKPKASFYGYVIVVIAFLNMMVGIGGLNSFGVFFDPLLNEFGWPRAVTSGAFSLCVILSGVLQMFTGRLNDKIGPRLLLTTCGFLLGLGYLLMAGITTVWQLYLVYGVLMGFGVSGILVPTLSTVTRWFSQRRGMMTGVVLMGIGTGMMVVPLGAGQLITHYGWRTAVTVTGIVTWIVIIIAAQFMRRDPQSIGQCPDGAPALKPGKPDLEAAGFSFREAIKTRQLWLVWTIYLCFGYVIYSVMVHIVVHATGTGISQATAFSLMAVIGGVNIAGRFITGTASDRVGSRRMVLINLSIMTLALIWLQFASSLWMLYVFAIIFGYAYSASALESTIVAELFGLKAHGVLFGMIDSGLSIGATIGPVITGYIFDRTGTYQPAFLVLIAIVMLGLVLGLSLRKPHVQALVPER